MRSSTLALVPGLTACLALAACGGTATTAGSTTTTTVTTTATTTAPSAAASTSSTATDEPTPTSDTTSATTPAAPATTPAAATQVAGGRCSALLGSLTREQKVGQLIMAALDTNGGSGQLDTATREHHVGNAVYLGGWTSSEAVNRTSAHLQSLATQETTGGIKMLVAADQEGGQVQQIRSLPPLVSAAEQGTRSSEWIREQARRVGTELKQLGVNLDLAPVADTVPASIGRANQPIGRWGRQYGNDPQTSSKGVVAFTEGLTSAGIGATVKHFPGLGRIRGNTDFAATGIDDVQATADDAYLQPFVDGWGKGAIVMMSSARYPKLDAENQAVFSRAIITDLLRGRLGYTGVVITDDMGHAKAVAAVPPGERATRFVDAGGDIVLTGDPADAGPMTSALVAKAEADPAFAAKVDAAAARVVTYKAGLGLATCG